METIINSRAPTTGPISWRHQGGSDSATPVTAHDGDVARLNDAISAVTIRARTVVEETLGKEAIGQFARHMAHEFNNLLTVMHNSVDLMRVPDLVPARKERYLNAMEAATDRAARLTHQMQDIARQLAPKRVRLDIAPRLAALATNNNFTLTSHEAELSSGYIVEVEPAGFDALISQLCAASQGDAPATTRLVVTLQSSFAQRQHGDGPTGGNDALIAITLSPQPEAAESARPSIAQNLLASLTAEGGPAAEWLDACSFIDAANGSLEAHNQTHDSVALTLYLPGCIADNVPALT